MVGWKGLPRPDRLWPATTWKWPVSGALQIVCKLPGADVLPERRRLLLLGGQQALVDRLTDRRPYDRVPLQLLKRFLERFRQRISGGSRLVGVGRRRCLLKRLGKGKAIRDAVESALERHGQRQVRIAARV